MPLPMGEGGRRPGEGSVGDRTALLGGLFIDFVNVAQRNVVVAKGRVVGKDSWGYLRSGARWSQTAVVGGGGSIYRNARRKMPTSSIKSSIQYVKFLTPVGKFFVTVQRPESLTLPRPYRPQTGNWEQAGCRDVSLRCA